MQTSYLVRHRYFCLQTHLIVSKLSCQSRRPSIINTHSYCMKTCYLGRGSLIWDFSLGRTWQKKHVTDNYCTDLGSLRVQVREPLIDHGPPIGVEDNGTVLVTLRDLDERENQRVTEFATSSCNCTYGPRQSPCCRQFTADHYSTTRSWFLELSWAERDTDIMAEVMSLTDSSDYTSSRGHVHKRQRASTCYLHNNRRVCLTTFLFLDNLKRDMFCHIRR